MGLQHLLSDLKPLASEQVDLQAGTGRALVDGHFLLHRWCSIRADVALSLVLSDNVLPLAKAAAGEVHMFERQGWKVTIVFDGATPPGKEATSAKRAAKREAALQRVNSLRRNSRGPIKPGGSGRGTPEFWARQAVALTPTVVARTSQVLKHLIRGDCMTAPFEADGQLVFLEDMYSRMGDQCHVYANDSDLVVLGVKSLLWEAKSTDGKFRGQCIKRASIIRPQSARLRSAREQGTFMWMLHGLGKDCESITGQPPLSEYLVSVRLLYYAILAGNDYVDFSNVGPVRAATIVLLPQATFTIREDSGVVSDMVNALVDVVTHDQDLDPCEIREQLAIAIRKARDMFCHQVVWNPESGLQQHLSAAPVGHTDDG